MTQSVEGRTEQSAPNNTAGVTQVPEEAAAEDVNGVYALIVGSEGEDVWHDPNEDRRFGKDIGIVGIVDRIELLGRYVDVESNPKCPKVRVEVPPGINDGVTQ